MGLFGGSATPAPGARSVLDDPKNMLGEKFDPSRSYSIVRPRDLARYLSRGYKVEIEEVLTAEGDENLVLVSIPEEGKR